MSIVTCENLIKIHRQGGLEVIALQGLDFTMEESEFVAVVGPSGAGKSSLLTILGGMDRPSAGRAEVAGTNLTEVTSPELVRHFRRTVGFMWQDFTRNLVPYLSAHANVELPMLLAGVSGTKRRRRTRELLEITGLGDVAYGRISQLSGGEQQRLALCIALAVAPKLLLADEPTGELDTENSLGVYELLRQMCHEGGLSVMVVTHDLALATRADRTVHLEDGRMLNERRADGRELLAVDKRGRVQLPKELLDQAGISGFLEAEMTEDGIRLRGTDGN
ncbi:MAG: ABC transporter ATP-binding protein [Acidimicrobiia bacterium]